MCNKIKEITYSMDRTIHIIGNLTKDPELRVTPSGRQVCNYTVAQNSITRQRKPDGSYSNEKDTLYFRVTTWGWDAERCGKYLVKGRRVAVHGELSVSVARDAAGKVIYRKDANGNYTDEPLINLEINAEGGTSFLSNLSPDENSAPAAEPAKAEATASAATASAPSATAAIPNGATVVEDEELPF